MKFQQFTVYSEIAVLLHYQKHTENNTDSASSIIKLFLNIFA